MQKTFSLKKGTPYPLGVIALGSKVNFAAVMNTKEQNGILLYERSTKRLAAKIPFRPEDSTGNICCGVLEDFQPEKYLYNFYSGNREYTDPYARAVCGNRKTYGEFRLQDDYDWQNDVLPKLPYEDSIFYLLHVKGFTMHRSSGVEHRGTFRGIQEKIPYMKELGITTIELMPAYEFEEKERMDEREETSVPDYMMERYKNAREVMKAAVQAPEESGRKEAVRINYWGYKSGYYFAPKRSYAAGERPDTELKDLIRELHKNGMEIILQFYFPREIKQGHIVEVLKYWILQYHIDGVHVKGERIPITLLATDPLMVNRKILYHDIPLQEIYEFGEQPAYRNLAFYRDDFMYDMRKFLKGDDNMLPAFVEYMKRNPQKAGVINYMTNYYGFTLEDLVSYDRKHNEANGEENRDGTEFNFSWNCGAEGKTRKKQVLELRFRQKRNAMVFLLLAQGTPLLRAGDEFGHSQKGNNNPYCQDNDISWLHWERMEKEKDFFSFVKALIHFRKEHAVFHQETALQMADYRSVGCPDLSLHGEEAWKAQMLGYEHHVGMMYCGKYASSEKDEPWLYVAYNMHWQRHRFALPTLPDGKNWEVVFGTGESLPVLNGEVPEGGAGCCVWMEPRTICLFQSVKKPDEKAGGGGKKNQRKRREKEASERKAEA
ncbi:MAG: hypothetical protein J6B10_00380 [Lachnospiraceae bacterium]|nr:hypothetical protein [Lachnospiraceae bacterium]